MGDRETGGTVRLFAAREFSFGIAKRLSRAMRGGGGQRPCRPAFLALAWALVTLVA